MSDVYIGRQVGGISKPPAFDAVSRVVLMVDKDVAYVSGNDSGHTIEAVCPYATQEMADALLAKLGGYTYKPVTATNALVDPAAELGDSITVDGVYTLLANRSTNFNALMASEISAPGQAEIESEYSTPTQKLSYDYQLAQVRSSITKTTEQILLEVAKSLESYATLSITDSKISAAVNSVNQSVDGKLENYATLSITDSKISTAVSSVNQTTDSKLSNYSTIQQTSTAISQAVNGLLNGEQVEAKITTALEGIELSVSNGSTSSSFTLKAGETTLSSGTIKMTGLVTVTGLSGGTTTIDGACIKTGTISAARLNLTGSIGWGDLKDGVEEYIDTAYQNASAAVSTVNAWGYTYDGTTYIDGTQIMTGTVTASELLGGYVGLLNSEEKDIGHLSISGASSAEYKIELSSDGALYLTADDGDVFLDGTNVTLSGTEYNTSGNDFIPNEDEVYDLGASWRQWDDIYLTNEATSASDREKKKDIVYDLGDYDSIFDGLKPCVFRFISGHGRKHIGMIAQDVEKLISDCGMQTEDLAAFIKSPRPNGTGYGYGLRYGEFIALLIDQVQKLKKRISALEATA